MFARLQHTNKTQAFATNMVLHSHIVIVADVRQAATHKQNSSFCNKHGLTQSYCDCSRCSPGCNTQTKLKLLQQTWSFTVKLLQQRWSYKIKLSSFCNKHDLTQSSFEVFCNKHGLVQSSSQAFATNMVFHSQAFATNMVFHSQAFKLCNEHGLTQSSFQAFATNMVLHSQASKLFQ
jgi:hypothetical protein